MSNNSYRLVSILLATIAMSPSLSAQVERWDLSFLDVNGVEVGSGWFEFDLSTIDILDPNPPELGTAAFPTRSRVDAFQSNVLGESFELGGEAWWDDPDRGTGMLVPNRSPIPTDFDGWLLGDPFEGVNPGQVVMRNDGTWNGYTLSSDGPNEGWGTWSAQMSPIPIPSTLPLLAVALLGMFAARKFKRVG